MAAKKSGGRRYGKAASKSVESAMKRRNKGTLKSGPGGKGGTVKSRAQAIAIGLSEAREKGAKVPAKKSSRKSATKKSSARKSTTKRAGAKRAGAKRAGAKRAGTKRAGTKRAGAKKSSSRKSARKSSR
jgi:hypothetical protein